VNLSSFIEETSSKVDSIMNACLNKPPVESDYEDEEKIAQVIRQVATVICIKNGI
jgi:hypothetical protein